MVKGLGHRVYGLGYRGLGFSLGNYTYLLGFRASLQRLLDSAIKHPSKPYPSTLKALRLIAAMAETCTSFAGGRHRLWWQSGFRVEAKSLVKLAL